MWLLISLYCFRNTQCCNLSCALDLQVQKRLGYCPQFDALIEQMTVVETLTMYARLRGVQESQIQTVIKSLMDGLLLNDFASKLAGNLRYRLERYRYSSAVAGLSEHAFILS